MRYELSREILAKTENDKGLPAKFTSVTKRRPLTSKRKLIGISSVFGEQKCMHEKWFLFCAISNETLYAAFLFLVKAVVGNSDTYMIISRLLSQLEEDDFIQQDGTSTYCHMAVERIPFWRWNFRTGASDFVWCKWPPISSDLPASCTVCTEVSFPSVKRESNRWPPSSIEVKKYTCTSFLSICIHSFMLRVWKSLPLKTSGLFNIKSDCLATWSVTGKLGYEYKLTLGIRRTAFHTHERKV